MLNCTIESVGCASRCSRAFVGKVSPASDCGSGRPARRTAWLSTSCDERSKASWRSLAAFCERSVPFASRCRAARSRPSSRHACVIGLYSASRRDIS